MNIKRLLVGLLFLVAVVVTAPLWIPVLVAAVLGDMGADLLEIMFE